jgi:hypothetical protein
MRGKPRRSSAQHHHCIDVEVESRSRVAFDTNVSMEYGVLRCHIVNL